jgi:CHAT domain-containing protein
VHFATHGIVRTDLESALAPRRGHARWLGGALERQLTGYDPMCLAALAFAGANPRKGGGEDDGMLTAAEASHLDLTRTDLVVLSACQTALGKAASGEGVLGLVRGFQMAGAAQVVASLWRVDDRATQRLMDLFYERLLRRESPLPPAAALREASLRLREDPRFAAPSAWAAFVIYGP